MGDGEAVELVRRLLRLGVVLSLAAAVVSAMGSSAFSVRQVEVRGAQTLSEDRVRSRSGVRVGQPLVAVDPHGVRRRLLSVPQVEEAWVEVVWPDRVILRIRERQPVAVLQLASGVYAPLDPRGVVVGWWMEPRDLPILYGISPPWTRPGEMVPSEPLRAAVKELAGISTVAQKVRSVTVERSGDYTVRTRSGLLVRANPGELERALTLAEEVAAGLRARGVEAAVLDMRFGERVVVRRLP